MLTVIIGSSVVGDEEQLLDVTLKYFIIQDPGAKHDDSVDIYYGVVASVEEFRDLLFTVEDQGDVFLVYTDSDSVPLAIGQVDAREEWILFRPGLPCVILIEEDRGAAQLQPQLLDALLIVNGDQEGLTAFLGFHGCQDGEVLRKIRLRVQLLGGHAELCIFRDSVGNIRLFGRSSSGTETCGFRYPRGQIVKI